jgi:mono/diheme cytochrome c family protein
MKHLIIAVAMAGAVVLGVASAHAADAKLDASKLPPASTQKDVTYAKDIKPIFDKSCVKCHGGAKPKGGLVLETLAGAIKGGKEGKVIVPGKSAESKMVFSIAHAGDEDDFMPPPDNKVGMKQLTKEEVGLIRAWIDQGAK